MPETLWSDDKVGITLMHAGIGAVMYRTLFN